MSGPGESTEEPPKRAAAVDVVWNMVTTPPIEALDEVGETVLLFVRGVDVLREEPPLCERCALAVSMTALYRWEIEEEEG